MPLRTSEHVLFPEVPELFLGGSLIPVVTTLRYLGFYISSAGLSVPKSIWHSTTSVLYHKAEARVFTILG